MDQRDVWNSIAGDWKMFREKPVREAVEFLGNKKGLILDLGCGSGRNFIKDGIIGADFSEKMLLLARKNKKIPLVLADATELPFADNSFDTVIFIAGLHCIKYNHHRQVLEEIIRVSKNRADVLITVWNKDQPRFAKSKKEATIPWRSKGKYYNRYYYLYSIDELEAMLKKHFSNVKVFGSVEKAFKRYPKNIIAVARVAKSGQRRKA